MWSPLILIISYLVYTMPFLSSLNNIDQLKLMLNDTRQI